MPKTVNARKDASGDWQICSDCEQSFHIDRGLNQHLRSFHLKKKLPLMLKHQGKHQQQQQQQQQQKHLQKKYQLPKRNMKRAIQVHPCDINGASIKIIYSGEIYLLLTKISYTGKRVYFCYHQDRQENGSYIRFHD